MLTNKEYQIMRMFMRDPRIVIPPSRILDSIWNPESRAEENTVWTYLSYLRRKLEAIGADIQIRNIRGAGYVLEKKQS